MHQNKNKVLIGIMIIAILLIVVGIALSMISEPKIGRDTLVDAILSDNEEQSDESIDFSQTSEDDGTKGLYYTSTNTENNETTYYYRGAVENNYVSFAGYYWRIIRINEDGSVRLLYQGETADATGENATIGSSAFNSSGSDNAYVGYMYGTPDSSTYEETHANINDSIVKMTLDSWYEENLLDNYAIYLSDTGFCGDRSIYDGLGYENNETYYGAYNRLESEYQPQFACPQENDLYTTSSSNKGNKALTYPIGLMTADEATYAGGSYTAPNVSYYLYTGEHYWLMSPGGFIGSYTDTWFVFSGGGLGDKGGVTFSVGVRPVINLVSGIEVTDGDGTSSNPYIVKTA